MVECPSCGTEVATALKSWPVSFGKQEQQEAPQLCIGIFECPKCKSKFRSRVEASAQPAESASIKELVEKIRGIREGFVQTLTTLRAKMSTLESDRAGLLVEVEELKSAAETRVNALEDEVKELREEIKSLKELFGPDSAEAS